MFNGKKTTVLCCTLAGVLLVSQPFAAIAQEAGEQDDEPQVSSSTATAPVDASSAPASGYPGLTTAIGDLNYKIELMQSRYLQLNNDIENLRSTDSAIRKMIAEDRLGRPDEKKYRSMEAQVELMRSDMAQMREEMAALSGTAHDRGASKSTEDRLRSPWVALTALGFSIIALLAR